MFHSHITTPPQLHNKQANTMVGRLNAIYLLCYVILHTITHIKHIISFRINLCEKIRCSMCEMGFALSSHFLWMTEKSIRRHFFLFSTREKFHTIIMNLVRLLFRLYFTILPQQLSISLVFSLFRLRTRITFVHITKLHKRKHKSTRKSKWMRILYVDEREWMDYHYY